MDVNNEWNKSECEETSEVDNGFSGREPGTAKYKGTFTQSLENTKL